MATHREAGADSPGAVTERRTRRRNWKLRLLTALVSPLLFLALAELALRTFDVGNPTGFFLPYVWRGAPWLVDNPHYSRRFFGSDLERAPIPFLTERRKPRDRYRVFVLGESAAMGDPAPAYGFPRILEVLLQHAYPETAWEVINAAMTSINSHTVREIADECARRQPDVFVAYIGNNEVIGPYGPGTIFQPFSSSQAYIRASLTLKRLRMSQLLEHALRAAMPDRLRHDRWGGMEMFLEHRIHPGDPRLAAVQRHLQSNLESILGAAHRAGARVLLCTVSVNLKSCAPFASTHRSDLSAADLKEWERRYEEAAAAERNGDREQALAGYRRALAIDDDFADLHFRAARLCDSLGLGAEARSHFQQAVDLDSLRFRATSEFNRAVRSASGRLRASDRLVDLEALVAQQSPAGLPGDDYFLDHVHFNFAGNYLVALRLLFEITQSPPAGLPPVPPEAVAVLSEQQCASRLAYTRVDEAEILEHMYQRFSIPPFTAQLDHDEHLARVRERLYALQDPSPRQAWAEATRAYQEAISIRPDDWEIHFRYAQLVQNDPGVAAEAYRRVAELLPHSREMRYKLALALAEQNRWDEAWALIQAMSPPQPSSEAAALSEAGFQLATSGRLDAAKSLFQQALALAPGLVDALNNLGAALSREGHYQEACERLEEALSRQPNNVVTLNNLASALAKLGRIDEAMAHLTAALKLDPRNPTTHFNLGVALASSERREESIRHLRESLDLDPRSADTHYNLALMLEASGNADEAEQQYQRAIAADPNLTVAHRQLARLYLGQRRPQRALSEFFILTLLSPEDSEAHVTTARLLVEEGSPDEALFHFRTALELGTKDAEAANDYAWILSTAPDPGLRSGSEALVWATRACEWSGRQSAQHLDTLAAAQAESGDFANAIRTAESALQLAQQAGDGALAQEIENRRALYASEQPYRDASFDRNGDPKR